MIIAIDFDGVLVEDRFPAIGNPIWPMIEVIQQLQHEDCELVLWTSRVDGRLHEAINWCTAHGLNFHAINNNTAKNLAKYGTDPRKVYADIYVDDHSIGYSTRNAVSYLKSLFGGLDNER